MLRECFLVLAAAALLQAQAAPDLLVQLREGDVPRRIAAADALVHPHPTPETVSALLAALEDPEPAVRIAVVTTIGFINRPSAEIVEPTAQLLADPNLAVVHRTLRLLADLNFRAAVAAPNLRRLLSHEAADIRGEAIQVLATLAGVTPAASDALVFALNDSSPVNQAAAVHGLAGAGQVPAASAPKLTSLLVGGDEKVRRDSAQALGRIASAGPDSVAALTRALDDLSPSVAQAARQALQQIEAAGRP